mmetsp:Transcript_10937/g.16823  ORF Transcript_10937/g.16823 Transcript_10937/m.16823 type:complete len:663 (+) Transcript_10937:319-2307(+)
MPTTLRCTIGLLVASSSYAYIPSPYYSTSRIRVRTTTTTTTTTTTFPHARSFPIIKAKENDEDAIVTFPPNNNTNTDEIISEPIVSTDNATEGIVQQIIQGTVIDPDDIDSSSLDSTTSSSIQIPSVKQMVRFAIPAMGVWLCSPILSMIDTSAVGLLTGTAQQAALSPAVSVTDYGGLLVTFMYAATTNLVSGASEADKENPAGPKKTAKTVMSALQLALWVGLAFGMTLGGFSKFFVSSLIGHNSNNNMDPTVLAAANRYVKIRSLGMPAAVVIGCAQSACLGMQDLKSPLYVLLAAAVVNAMGDFLFVGCQQHAWIGGCAGAAWATVASQYAALGLFMKYLTSKPKTKKVDISNNILELTTKSKEGKSRRQQFKKRIRKIIGSGRLLGLTKKKKSKPPPLPSRGVLADQFRARDLFRFPPRDEAQKFRPFFVPVTAHSLGRISGYISMAHVASAALGTIDMAAQAILMSILSCFFPLPESIGLTAQSFVPPIYEKTPSRERANALRQTFRNFCKVGILFSSVLICLVSMIPWVSPFFTNDLAVRAAVQTAIPTLLFFFSASGLMNVGEGMLLGMKDLTFLRNVYTIWFFAVPYFMLRLKRRALLGLQIVRVGTMWQVFTIYQWTRVITKLSRLLVLQRRTDAQVVVVAQKKEAESRKVD